MKINAVSNVNYNKYYSVKKNENVQVSSPVAAQTNFKGLKGAAIGTLGGLAYLAAVSVLAAPFMPITLGAIALCGGAGAVAGHNIQKSYQEDKKNNNDNKNINN